MMRRRPSLKNRRTPVVTRVGDANHSKKQHSLQNGIMCTSPRDAVIPTRTLVGETAYLHRNPRVVQKAVGDLHAQRAGRATFILAIALEPASAPLSLRQQNVRRFPRCFEECQPQGAEEVQWEGP